MGVVIGCFRKKRSQSQKGGEVGMTKNRSGQGRDLVRPDSGQLTVASPQVVAVARSLRWRPPVLLRRLQEALPAPVEQRVYLAVAGEMSMHPETFGKLLRTFLGGQTLQPVDLQERVVGKNLVTSRIAEVGDYLESALALLGKIQAGVDGISISAQSAGKLAMAYGEYAVDIVGQIVEGVEEIREALGIGPEVPRKSVVGVAIRHITNHAHDSGCTPLTLNVLEFFQDQQVAGRGKRRRYSRREDE